MRKINIFKFIVFFSTAFIFLNANAWGFLGHRTINRQAVFALPPEMFAFYKAHIEYITAHSIDPDNRRYLMEDEACKHYLDCDRYEHNSPLDTLPHNWYKAIDKYTEDTLRAHGIVPWNTLLMLQKLTKAFEENDLQKILKYSADIGHYIADAHVPLHANSNYNGQKSGQEGIHALWESRIPQLYLDSFDLLTGTADYLENPSDIIWQTISESFSLTDSVFKLEIRASNLHPENKYAVESKGRNMVPVYSENFCKDYNELMQDMVEKRMRKSIHTVAAFWYTAWVNAGQPDLSKLEGNVSPDKIEEDAEKAKNTEKIKGREEAN
jgi:hypothetical protein